jgi:hypothetical protein
MPTFTYRNSHTQEIVALLQSAVNCLLFLTAYCINMMRYVTRRFGIINYVRYDALECIERVVFCIEKVLYENW